MQRESFSQQRATSLPRKCIESCYRVLSVAEYNFYSIFAAEMLFKVVANGCMFGAGAYFKDGWNVLDGCLVIISLFNVIVEFAVSGGTFL